MFAGTSDLLDGYFARQSKLISRWGARYDPLADKIVTLVPMLWLCQEGKIPFWAIWIIIIRDIIITAKRKSDHLGHPANKLAKIKSLSLFLSITFFLWPLDNSIIDTKIILQAGYQLFWISLALSIISAIDYFMSKSTSRQ